MTLDQQIEARIAIAFQHNEATASRLEELQKTNLSATFLAVKEAYTLANQLSEKLREIADQFDQKMISEPEELGLLQGLMTAKEIKANA
ncbi:hypothetical protein [Arcanobacterium phocae]|uniref:hypothetical protein n=1 Tax=Arcanobacterium phocae TaxID=131112 RepID=UPI001C0ED8CB|nr:hypothetical protein [Arcanobacterium phocae]